MDSLNRIDKQSRQWRDLAAGDIHSTVGERGMVVRCEAGLVWVTQEGDPLDHVVPAGARFCAGGPGRIVVSAVSDGTRIAVYRVEPKPAADWTRNTVRVDADYVERVRREARQQMARWFAALVIRAARGLKRAWRRLFAAPRRALPCGLRGYHGC